MELVRCVALYFVLFRAVASGQEGGVLPESSDNAAIHYWKAVALLAEPEDAEEIRAVEFIEGELQELPPRAIKGRGAVRAMLNRDIEAIRALHEGVSKPQCNFDLDYAKGPALELPHLARVRKLARRALAVAKLHQLKGNQSEAARVYGDLMKLAAHLDEDRILISGLVGVALVDMTASEIEGFLAREPAGEACKLLLATLGKVPSRPFHAARSIRTEVKIYGDRPQDLPELLAPLLEDLDKEEQREIVDRWLEDYRVRMKRLAEALEEPYPTAREYVREMGAQVRAEAEAVERDPMAGNALVAMLMPALESALERQVRAEARLAMCRIACAAMLSKALEGACPSSLRDLVAFFPQGLPKEPFTGTDHIYWLDAGLPCVQCPGQIDLSIDVGARRRRAEASPEDEDPF